MPPWLVGRGDYTGLTTLGLIREIMYHFATAQPRAGYEDQRQINGHADRLCSLSSAPREYFRPHDRYSDDHARRSDSIELDFYRCTRGFFQSRTPGGLRFLSVLPHARRVVCSRVSRVRVRADDYRG